ncbi:MAG: DUF4870 domain-containing protein [Hyphomicrobiales bacterium]
MTQDDDPIEKQIDDWMSPGPNNVRLVYILYLVSFVIGITCIVGLVFAYMNRSKAAPWLQTHYTYLIRTFWIGVLAFFIALVLTIILVGIPLMIAIAVWAIVRCVIGLQKVSRNEPIEDPETWLI